MALEAAGPSNSRSEDSVIGTIILTSCGVRTQVLSPFVFWLSEVVFFQLGGNEDFEPLAKFASCHDVIAATREIGRPLCRPHVESAAWEVCLLFSTPRFQVAAIFPEGLTQPGSHVI